MRTQIIRKYVYKWLPVVLAAALWQSCAKEHDIPAGGRNGEVSVQFAVATPAAVTRSMTAVDETAVSTIDVYHFTKPKSSTDDYANYTAVSHTPAQGSFTPGSPGWINVRLSTMPGVDSRLVIVINGVSADYPYHAGMTLRDFTAGLIFEETGEWYQGTPRPLPMYCITQDVELTGSVSTINNGGIPYGLIRMHAKVNVSVEASVANFRLASVCVFNRKTRGSVAYDESRMDVSIPNAPKATAPYIPATTATAYLPGIAEPYYTAGTDPSVPDTYGKIINQQYLFEADNGAVSDRLDKTALVVGGYYESDTKASYYRVDIDATGGNILRNRLYQVEVQSVSARGYGTAEEAFIGASQLTATVTDWNLADQKLIANGQHYLIVDKDQGHFPLEGGEITVEAATDFDGNDYLPAGLYVEAGEIEYTPSSSSGWVGMTDLSGSPGSSARELKFTVAPNDAGGDRSAKVKVKAGNFTKVINITQDVHSWIRFGLDEAYALDGSQKALTATSVTSWTAEIKAATNAKGAVASMNTLSGGTAGTATSEKAYFTTYDDITGALSSGTPTMPLERVTLTFTDATGFYGSKDVEVMLISGSPSVGEANCYLINPSNLKPILIPLSQVGKAMGASPGVSTYELGSDWIADYSRLKAQILWSDVNKFVMDGAAQSEAVVVGAACRSTANTADGYVVVHPGGGRGNAVVILYEDMDGVEGYTKDVDVIRWSWHIWNGGYYPYGVYPASNIAATGNGQKWMNRNLGATSNLSSTDNLATHGLFYQWGRKDPQPSMGRSYSAPALSSTSPHYTPSYVHGVYFSSAPHSEVSNLGGATSHPLIRPYDTYDITQANWYTNDRTSTAYYALWGATGVGVTTPNAKSVYDPCPEGYKVPYYGAYGTADFTAPVSNSYGLTLSSYGGYYPLTGYRYASGMTGYMMGSSGQYWTATMFGGNNAYSLGMGNSGSVLVSNRGVVSTGRAVRCIAE